MTPQDYSEAEIHARTQAVHICAHASSSSLRRSPGLVAIAVASPALGIGANLTVYGLRLSISPDRARKISFQAIPVFASSSPA